MTPTNPRTPLRRHRGRLALVSAALLVTAACGSNDEADDAAADGGGEGSGCSTVSFTVLPFVTPAFEELAASYSETQDEVTVEVRQAPDVISDYVQQLATAQLGGTAPDLFMNLDVIAEQLADSGFSEDLTNWFGEGEGGLRKEDFAGEFLNSYVPLADPDAVTGLPVAADATVVFYNKQVFEQAGVPFPTDDWTYDEFNETANQISAAGAGAYWGLTPAPPGTTPVTVWQAQYQPMIVAHGGFVYDKDSNTSGIGEPEAIEAWTQILQPWQEGGVPPYESVSGAAPPEFAGGTYGMLVGVRAHIPGVAEALGDNWDVVQMPEVDGTRPVGGGSYGLGMAADSECKAEAWDFINWFYSNEGGISQLQANKSVVPPTVEGIESGAWRDLPAPPANVDAFAAAIDDAVIAPQLPGGAQATLDEAVLNATQEVLLNGVPIEEAFGKAQDAVNAELESQN